MSFVMARRSIEELLFEMFVTLFGLLADCRAQQANALAEAQEQRRREEEERRRRRGAPRVVYLPPGITLTGGGPYTGGGIAGADTPTGG